MVNEKYTLETADKLIALWSPRVKGFIKNINGQTVTVTALSKEKIGEQYKIWVETDSPYRDELTEVVHANEDFLNLHFADIKGEPSQDI